MFYLEILILMQGLLIILMLIFLHKINLIKEQINHIMKEVNAYLSFVEEDVGKESNQMQKKGKEKISMDDAQNHLIQAVLKEYFP